VDFRELSALIKTFVESLTLYGGHRAGLLILDEITFVKDWPRVIKGLVDKGRGTLKTSTSLSPALRLWR